MAVLVVAGVCAAPAQSRLLQDSLLGLSEVVYHSEPAQVYLGSPSLLRTRNGSLLVSADRFGSGFKSQRNVSLHRSDDNGTTWRQIAWVQNQYWSNLFTLPPASSGAAPGSGADTEERVFMLGTSSDGPSPIKIAMSRDAGETWDPADSAVLANSTGDFGYETGPTPSLMANGRVYRAMERFRKPFVWGVDYEAVVVSAAIDSDLLDPQSWRLSASLPFNLSWAPASWRSKMQAPGYLEGNMVLGPDGKTVYNVLRFNTRPGIIGNKAIVLKYDEEANALAFVGIIDLPGGHTKFVIRRDPETGLYLTLSNPNYELADQDQRNVLVLCASKNLFDWTVVTTLLMDDTGFLPADSVRYTGFHYVFWQFDGADIIYSVRTAYRGAESYHNSNRITYKKLADWRSVVGGINTMTTEPWPLVPAFSKDVLNYTVFVPVDSDSVNLTVASVEGTVTVDGAPVVNETATLPVLHPLSVFTVQVQGAGLPPQTYGVSVEVVKPPVAAKVVVSGSGYTLKPFSPGKTAWSDRTYTWQHVPPQLAATFSFTQIAGGAAAGSVKISGKAASPGFVAVASGDAAVVAQLESEGWSLDEDLSFQYTDTNDTVMKVLRRTVQTGDAWSVPQGGWTGCIMLGDLAAA